MGLFEKTSTSFVLKKDIIEYDNFVPIIVGNSSIVGNCNLLTDVQNHEQKEDKRSSQSNYIYITKSRLQELEFLEKNLSTIIQIAVEESDQDFVQKKRSRT